MKILSVLLLVNSFIILNSSDAKEFNPIDVLIRCRATYDEASLDLPTLLNAKNQQVILAKIDSKSPVLLGDLYFDESTGTLTPFHRPVGQPPTKLALGNIHVLKSFQTPLQVTDLAYDFQQPMQLFSHGHSGPVFSPYDFAGTYYAIVVLPISLSGKYLQTPPITFLLAPDLSKLIENIDLKSLATSMLDSQTRTATDLKGGDYKAAIDTALSAQSNPIARIESINMLAKASLPNDYDSLNQLLNKTREEFSFAPELPIYIFLKSVSPNTEKNILENLVKYVNTTASSDQVQAISWAYVTYLQTNPFFDRSNLLQSSLMAKLDAISSEDALALKNILSKKKQIP